MTLFDGLVMLTLAKVVDFISWLATWIIERAAMFFLIFLWINPLGVLKVIALLPDIRLIFLFFMCFLFVIASIYELFEPKIGYSFTMIIIYIFVGCYIYCVYCQYWWFIASCTAVWMTGWLLMECIKEKCT